MTYQPLIGTEGLDFDEGATRQSVEDAIVTKGATHVRTTSGDVWKIFTKLNKKSVPLNNAGRGPQRIGYAKVESFGVLIDDDEQPAGSVGEKPVALAEANSPEAPAHTGRAHALLSASSAHRWLHCTPAPHLEEQHPDSESDAAAEGTAAHELAEYKLHQLLDEDSVRPTSDWQDEDMDDYTDSYADRVMAELAQTKETSPAAFLSIEQRVDFSHIVPDGFGTADALIVGDQTMTIVDFKYGRGVQVDAEDNPQMMLYALGALRQFDFIYDIKQVRMVIFQPRIGNISVCEKPVEELRTWAEEVVKPRAELAMAGEGELTAGEWCQFCRHAPNCPAVAKQHFDILPAGDAPLEPTAPEPDTLTDAQIATIVTHAPALKKWLGAVEKYALDQANNGHGYDGLKLVEGRSVRKYKDADEVAKAVQDAGHDPYERKLLGITAMTKLLGKKNFEEVLGDLVYKPAGALTLVPSSDKRPEVLPATAETVFEPITKGA